jgi:hypothetical protein
VNLLSRILETRDVAGKFCAEETSVLYCRDTLGSFNGLPVQILSERDSYLFGSRKLGPQALQLCFHFFDLPFFDLPFFDLPL